MKKIVHVVNYYIDKIKYQEYYLVNEHIKSGHEVHVVTSCLNFPFANYDSTMLSVLGERKMAVGDEVREGGVIVHKLPYYFELRGRVFMKNLLEVIRRINPDYIICHGIVNVSAVRLLYYKKGNCKIIFDDHMLKVQIDKSAYGKALYSVYRKLFSKRLTRVADKIVAVADNCVDTISGVYGVPRNKIEVISLGADSHIFRVDETWRAESREKLGIGKDDLVVIFTGKMIIDKKPHLIIDALEKIKSQIINKNVVVLFVGNGSAAYKEMLDQHIAGSSFRCIKIGNLPAEELSKTLNAADIAVWPVEATISTLEASACGLPVICPVYLTERYKNNNGIGIEPGNVDQLADGLLRLINDDDDRKLMGKNGRELIMREMPWEIIARRFLYSTIIFIMEYL
jgi:glycosyltransferase involved in cell wall biosynthesis